MRRRSTNTRSRSFALAAVLMCAILPGLGLAQNPRLQLNNRDKLNSKAAEVNDVTLDGALLALASKFVDAAHDPEAAQVKEVLHGGKGIYIKNFEFDDRDQNC